MNYSEMIKDTEFSHIKSMFYRKHSYWTVVALLDMGSPTSFYFKFLTTYIMGLVIKRPEQKWHWRRWDCVCHICEKEKQTKIYHRN